MRDNNSEAGEDTFCALADEFRKDMHFSEMQTTWLDTHSGDSGVKKKKKKSQKIQIRKRTQ